MADYGFALMLGAALSIYTTAEYVVVWLRDFLGGVTS